MDTKDHREQETITHLKKELLNQKFIINELLDTLEIYTCRDGNNPYYKETFSIPCYNAKDFLIFSYRYNIHSKAIKENIIKLLKILGKEKKIE